MATPPRLNEEAVHADGRVARWDGREWRIVSGPTRNIRGGRSGGIPREEAPILERLRQQAQEGEELERVYNRAAGANERLQSGPWRGALLDAAMPNEGGVLDTIGAALIGGPLRLTGAISSRDVEDYQTLQAARNEGVLNRQLEQRGVQTESDAARMAMAELRTGNTPERNRTVIQQGINRARRMRARSAYYSQWAARFGGINGTRNSRGQTVEDAWNQYGDAFTQRMFSRQQDGQQRGRVTIRRVN